MMGEIRFYGLPRWRTAGSDAVLVAFLAIAICVLAGGAITA